MILRRGEDPFAALVFEPLAQVLMPWVQVVNDHKLFAVVAPDGQSLVIFNDHHLDRGCIQLKATGEMLAGWSGRPWETVTEQEVRDLLKDHFAS